MRGTRGTVGLIVAIAAGMTFGASGAFIKPLLESGWSPAAAVTFRALIGGVVLAPVAIVALRGRWSALWRARWRVLGMGLIGVAGCQLAYFASVQRIHVGTAILIEYLAPIALVGLVWARTRHVPKPVVIAGSAVAVVGLVLVVGPSALGGGDLLGIVYALIAMVGCAAYFVIAARPSDGLPPVALAAAGLLVGAGALALVGATGLVPLTISTAPVVLTGAVVPFFVPLLIVGVIATAIAYVASISASEMLGSRLASFLGLLEVVFATLYAWLLLGESLGPVQLGGGVLILLGIGLVRSDRSADALPEEVVATMPIAVVGQNGSDGLPGEPSPRDAGLPAR
jgi:drug/metabolite transporter (DMT)-like permease